MSFGTPAALFWLALAAVITALYILKVRLRRVPVSTNIFWKQIYEEKPPRSIWQYLRHLLSLLLQLLMLCLLVFAIADPYLPWQLTQAQRIVLVIDRSASMQSSDVEPTRFAAAIEAAHAYVEGLRERDEMSLVLADPSPEVVIGMNSHPPTLKRALDAIELTDGPTELEPAIELAHQLVGDHPKGHIIVLTDGCTKETAESQPEGDSQTESNNTDEGTSAPDEAVTSTKYRIFATEAANVGITQFQVRRSLLDPLGYEILAAVSNASSNPIECRLEIELDGLPVDILPLEIAPEESWSRSIEKTSLEGGRLSARLTDITLAEEDDSDADADETVYSSDQNPEADAPSLNHLSTDDMAWAVLPPREIQRVLIVTPGNLFLQKVFEANPLVEVEVVRELPEQWPSDTLIVLHQFVPEALPAGDVFVVDPTESTDQWKLGETLANPIVTEQDTESPLMTHVRLDNVLMPEARKIEPVGDVHVLAGSLSEDPIYAEVMREDGKCLVLTANLEQSDLAFRTAFPIMVSNALGWFAGTSGELNRALATGDVSTISIPLPDEAALEGLRLMAPDGQPEAIALSANDPQLSDATEASSTRPEQDETTIGPLDLVGVYEIDVDQTPNDERQVLTSFAVNLANKRESDLRPTTEMLEQQSDSPAVAGLFSRPVWFYLAALACLLTVTEWFLYNRRFID